MRNEWARGGSACDIVQHGRLNLHKAPRPEKLAYLALNPRAQHKSAPRIVVDNQIEVSLAVYLLAVGESVPFFRQRTQALCEYFKVVYAHGYLAGLCLEKFSLGADYIAYVEKFFEPVVVNSFGETVAREVQLYDSVSILYLHETRFSHQAENHNPSCNAYFVLRIFAFWRGFVERFHRFF